MLDFFVWVINIDNAWLCAYYGINIDNYTRALMIDTLGTSFKDILVIYNVPESSQVLRSEAKSSGKEFDKVWSSSVS